MKTLKFLAFALVAMLAASCGGSKSDGNEVKLQVEAELGELGNYLTVSDQEVTVSLKEEQLKGEAGKVIAGSFAVDVTTAVASDYSYTFEVKVLDKNHVEIADLPHFSIDGTTDYDNGDLNRILSAGTVRAQMKDGKKNADWTDEDQKMWDKICEEGAYIVIKPAYNAKYAEYKGGESSGSSVESSDEETTESDAEEVDVDGSEDWDALLDSYEEFVDDYIRLMKKAQQGDMDAVSEYTAYMEKAQTLGNKLANAKGNMSASQVARYTKIMGKMMKAAQ